MKNDNAVINLDKIQMQVTDNQNTTTQTDLFTLAKLGNTSLTKNGTVFTLCPPTSKGSYMYKYDITVNNQFIGQLDIQHTKSKFVNDRRLYLFTADNQFLYMAGYSKLLIQFLNDFNLQQNNCQKLEIAIDTDSNIVKRFFKYFDNDSDYHYCVNQKLTNSVKTVSTRYRNGHENVSIYLNLTNKSFKTYNKSVEVVTNNKPYIEEYHRLNGLVGDVHRSELTLNNAALDNELTKYHFEDEVISKHIYKQLTKAEQVKYTPVREQFTLELDKLEDDDYLLTLFYRYSGKLIQFRKKDNAHISRCTVVPLLRISANIQPLKRNLLYTTATYSTNMNKHVIKSNLTNYVNSNYTKSYFLEAAKDIAATAKLDDYLNEKLEALKKSLTVNSSNNNRPTNDTSLF